MPFALYMLALAVFVMGTSEFMLAGLLPAIALDLDVSVGTAGLLTSAFAVGMVIGAPAMAAFARRFPPRRTLIACLVVFAASHGVGAMTPVFGVLLVTRVLSALANAGFLAVALGTATALVAPGHKGRALSVLLSGTTVATVAGVPAGALLGTALGWRATFWAVALLTLPAIVGVLRGVGAEVAAPGPDLPAPRLRTELHQLTRRPVMQAMVLGALVNGATFAALTFLAPVVTDTAGLAEAWVPVVLVMFGCGSFAGVTIAGRFSDRRPGLLLALGGPLLLAGWIALALFAAHPTALVALAFAQGLLSFGVASTLITRVLYAASGAPTMAGAYATMALNFGAAVGPALGALGIATGFGSQLGAGAGAAELAPFWVAAALTAAALALMGLFRGATSISREP